MRKKKARESMLKKICELCPGDPAGINAMKNKEGNITTPPNEIAEIFKEHRGGVFKKKQVDTAALQIWMEDLFRISSSQDCRRMDVVVGASMKRR